MKNKILILVLLVAAFLAGGIYFYNNSYASERKMSVITDNDMPDIKGWPEASQVAAKEMMKKYGKPTEVTEHKLVWMNNGPWKRTVVFDKESKHMFPVDHTDVMEQTIDYKVPVEKAADVFMYDGSVTIKRTDGEISAKCDKEAANFLAINLANDVATGKKSVEAARTFYANTIKDFALQNKMSPYMQSLQFSVSKSDTGDPDKHAVSEADNAKIIEKMKQMAKEMKEKEMGQNMDEKAD
jgi:hypothetical protein